MLADPSAALSFLSPAAEIVVKSEEEKLMEARDRKSMEEGFVMAMRKSMRKQRLKEDKEKRISMRGALTNK